MEILKSIDLILVEIIFAIIVFRMILKGWKPPMQESKQALLCVALGVILSMIVDFSVHGFIAGVVAAGIGFYGGTYFKEIKDIKKGKEDLEG